MLYDYLREEFEQNASGILTHGNFVFTPKMMIYTRDTDQLTKAIHIKNVNDYWADYDIIIYSPTISVGISFDIPNKFDNIFLYTCNDSCNVL